MQSDANQQRTNKNAGKLLDFLVVGAAKSGTTSLHHYLGQHPQIFLPQDKELPFFSKQSHSLDAKWQEIVRKHYKTASMEMLWGKITPHYMDNATIPQRIHSLMPDVKLIAILRNPIERAVAYYSMLVRDGKEQLLLNRSIASQLEPTALIHARHGALKQISHRHTYVVRGEYGRIIGDYLDHFPAAQMQIILMDDLIADSQKVIDSILTHIGLPPGFTPTNLNEVYNPASLPNIQYLRRALKKIPLGYSLWKTFPPTYRTTIEHWLEKTVGIRFPAMKQTLTPKLHAQLVELYAPDVKKLEALLGKPTPWQEFH